MERKLEEIDEILASYEDWMHGINGEQCTKARKLLSEVQQQLENCNLQSVSNMVAKYCEMCEEVTEHRIIHACQKCDKHL